LRLCATQTEGHKTGKREKINFIKNWLINEKNLIENHFAKIRRITFSETGSGSVFTGIFLTLLSLHNRQTRKRQDYQASKGMQQHAKLPL
jgi:hypothetical protein